MQQMQRIQQVSNQMIQNQNTQINNGQKNVQMQRPIEFGQPTM